MREQELIVYREFEDGELLHDMAFLMTHYNDAYYNKEDLAALFYEDIHKLLDLAGTYGFHGNLWHCYLTNLLVNNENSYSKACEIRGKVEGTINKAVLHDILIFKELYDFDFTPVTEALNVPEYVLLTDYEASSEESKVYNKRICSRICELAEKFCNDHTDGRHKEGYSHLPDHQVGALGRVGRDLPLRAEVAKQDRDDERASGKSQLYRLRNAWDGDRN